MPQTAQAPRCFWFAFLALCLTAPAQADVIYFKPNAPGMPRPLVQQLQAAGADLATFSPPGKTPPETWLVVRGRIWEVRNTSPVSFMVQPCKTTIRSGARPQIQWITGSSFQVSITDIARIHHELDDLQDIRWMVSNRDVLLWKTKQPSSPNNPFSFGYEPFNSYFRAGGGIPGQSFPAGLTFPITSPVTVSGTTYQLQEGWLNEWLKFYRANGRERDGAQRAQLVQQYMAATRQANGGQGGPPNQFLPALLETQINVAVSSLLRAAAMDRRYIYTDMFGFGVATDPVSGQRKAKFATLCKRVVKLLCDLVVERDVAAQELGHRAREAVVRALEGAAIGRPDPYDRGGTTAATPAGAPPTAQIVKARRKLALRKAYRNAYRVGKIQRNVAAARVLIQDALRLAGDILGDEPGDPTATQVRQQLVQLNSELNQVTPAPAPTAQSQPVAQILVDFPVDPTEIAVIAMEVISESGTWQIPQYDSMALWSSPPAAGTERAVNVRPGYRLAKAVLELARDGQAGLARMDDGPRSNMTSVTIEGANVQITELEHAVRETLKHLLQERPQQADAAEFRRHVANLLVDSISNEAALTAEDGDPDTWVVDRGMREIATGAMAESGYAEALVMRDIVDRLFTMAKIDTDDPDLRRSSLRRQIQRDAVATLAHLASLNTDGEREAARRQRKREIAKLVLDQVDSMASSTESGFGSQGDRQFFRTLNAMMHQPMPPRPLEGHATNFMTAYRTHLSDLLAADPSIDRRELKKVEEAVLRRLTRGGN